MKNKSFIAIILGIITITSVGCANEANNQSQAKKDNNTTISDQKKIEDQKQKNIEGKNEKLPESNIVEEPQPNNPPTSSNKEADGTQFYGDIQGPTQPPTPSAPEDNQQAGGNASNSIYLANVEEVIFNATNAERQKAGLAPYVRNATANSYGRSKSKDMLDNNYFDHNSPTNGYISDIAKRDGWSYSKIGENIYTSTGMGADGQSIVNSWMNSQGHRENILNSGFKELGVGVVELNGKLYATQIFYTK